MDSSKQESLWVLQAQCGDREALELLLRHIQPSLHRYLSSLVGATDADDLVQEVFVLVFRKLIWLESPELFRPWLFRIASRLGVRYLKKKQRWQESDDSELENLAVPEPPPGDELLQRLETSDALSASSRPVMILHYREEMSLPEVAAVLELPIGTVKSRLAYGLASLRKQLESKRRS